MSEEIMRKKLDLYERFFEEMLEINQEESKLLHNQALAEQNRIKSQNIEDNFIYLDEERDLRELSIKEQKAISEQNNLHNYENLKTQVNKYQNIYSVAKYVTYIPKWYPFA